MCSPAGASLSYGWCVRHINNGYGDLGSGGSLPFGQMQSKGRSSENTPSEAIRSNMFEKIFLNRKLCHAVHYNSVANRSIIYVTL